MSSKKRYLEAARVLLDYSKDVREAVISLVQGNHFSEARRIVSIGVVILAYLTNTRVLQTILNSVSELVTDIIHPGALESRVQLTDEINEMRDQLRKQINRLRELRLKKVEEPGAFYQHPVTSRKLIPP